MRKIFLTLSVYLFFTSSAWAYNPPDVVYRLDLRGPEIIGQIGFQPRTNGPGSNRNMIPHIDGSSLVNQTSSLVSTSASVGQAVNHIRAFGLIDPETETYSSEHVFYLYSIRPSDEFYDVRHTLETASATPDAPDRSPNFIHQRQALLDRANFFDDADEVIATQGIGPDRILAYAEVTGTMLNDDHWFRRMWEADDFDNDDAGIEHPPFRSVFENTSYWNCRWQPMSPSAEVAQSSDRVNSGPYPYLGELEGIVLTLADTSRLSFPSLATVAPTTLAFSCLGIDAETSTPDERPRSFSRRHLPSTALCPPQSLRIKSVIYDTALLLTIIGSSE